MCVSVVLLDAYLMWLPSDVHTDVKMLWPPCGDSLPAKQTTTTTTTTTTTAATATTVATTTTSPAAKTTSHTAHQSARGNAPHAKQKHFSKTNKAHNSR
jgi:hypothetical protein